MNTPAAIVFYDGGCPLCRREINHYRRRRGADRVLWIDITQDEGMLAAHGLSKAQAMARFHVRDASGEWHTGARGFIELWKHLRGYRWLARVLRLLRLVSVLERAYTRFARWRLNRRCTSSRCRRELTASPARAGDAAQR